MSEKYLLFSAPTSNLLGSYETEEEAFDAVAKGLRAHGPGSASHLVLQRTSGRGPDVPVAAGAELERSALAHLPEARSA
jgi:hypothetical protein